MIDDAKLKLEREQLKAKLINRSEIVIGSLQRLINQLESHNRVSNSIGVIQSNGSEIDRMCGEFQLISDILDGGYN